MSTEVPTLKFGWNLTNKILSSQHWTYGEQFFLMNVSFEVGLKMSTDHKILNVRVRKNDPRPANAHVEISISETNRSHPQESFGLNFPPREFFPITFHTSPYNPGNFTFHQNNHQSINAFNNSIRTLRVNGNMVERQNFTEWKEWCSLDNFKSFANDNQLIQFWPTSDCCITSMYIHCTIQWHGFNKLEHKKNVLEVFKPFLKADLFSDIVIVVENNELPAHKCILAAHSPYFLAMFTTDMKESKENRVVITNFTFDIISEMLEYFYTNKTKASEDPAIALKMIPVADMFQIESLKEICEATLSRGIQTNNVLDILCIADDYNVVNLRRKTMDFLIRNKQNIVTLPEFHNLCLARPQIMYEFTCNAI